MGALVPIIFSGYLRAQAETETWFLMSRHGECAPIMSLHRKIPDLGTINEPRAFISLMQEKGYQVEVGQLYQELMPEQAITIRIPEKGLSLLFVRQNLCQSR